MCTDFGFRGVICDQLSPRAKEMEEENCFQFDNF